MGTILLVTLILLLLGAFPTGGYGYGYGIHGGIGLVLVILIVLILAGRF